MHPIPSYLQAITINSIKRNGRYVFHPDFSVSLQGNRRGINRRNAIIEEEEKAKIEELLEKTQEPTGVIITETDDADQDRDIDDDGFYPTSPYHRNFHTLSKQSQKMITLRFKRKVQ